MSGQAPGSAPAVGPDAPGGRGAPRARERLNLIDQITADAVASDYSAVDPERRDGTTRRQRALIAALSLGLAGFLLALGVSTQLLNAPIVAEQKQELRDRIGAAEARQDELVAEAADLRQEVEAARAAELERVAGGEVLAGTIADFELATGYTAVEGPGVVVTLQDAPVADGEQPDDLEQVLDSDIQRAVNGLWSARAEAVSVNGSRLTARSAIRSAAGAILVNYRPLRPPYRIEAIGPRTMLDAFRASQDAAELRGVSEQFGIGFSSQAVDRIVLAAATSALPETAEVVTPEEGDNP